MISAALATEQFSLNSNKLWYREGNVQTAIVEFLAGKEYQIQLAANTLTKEQGEDIIAVSSAGRELWVSVKGRPEGTSKTTPYLMARHTTSTTRWKTCSFGKTRTIPLTLHLGCQNL